MEEAKTFFTMKKSFFTFLALLALVFVTTNAAQAQQAEKRQQVHNVYTSTNGCVFHVDGWVDLDPQWSFPFVHISGYHLVISASQDCGGNHTFNGRVSSGASPNGTGYSSGMAIQGTLLNTDTGEEEDTSASPFLAPLLAYLQERYHG